MLKRENVWVESIHYSKNDSKVVINFRDLAPWASNRGSIWFDLILLEKDKEQKRIGGIAPFDCVNAALLQEELILLEKLTSIHPLLKSFENFDFAELAIYVASYINIFNLTEGRAGQLAFPEILSDGWEAVWYENHLYDFESRWDVVPVEVEEIEEVEDEDEDDLI